MQIDKEHRNGVKFIDRLKKLTREKEDGEEVTKGGLDGVNMVRIHEGIGGTRFVTANCLHLYLLNANITKWPASVSFDGLAIALWLFDTSLGRKAYKRKFTLTFIDEQGASKFFEEFIIGLTPVGPSYFEMRDGIEMETTEEDREDNKKPSAAPHTAVITTHVKDNRKGIVAHTAISSSTNVPSSSVFERECNIDEEGSLQDEGDKTATNEDIDSIFESEMALGHSQSLFNPMSPSYFEHDEEVN